MSKSIVITKFVIYNEHNEEVAIVSEKHINQKSQIFKEFKILVGVKEYDVQYTLANRSFSIKNSHGELCVEGNRITSIFKNIINLRKYKVDIYDNQLDLNLWLVIIKGMQVLE